MTKTVRILFLIQSILFCSLVIAGAAKLSINFASTDPQTPDLREIPIGGQSIIYLKSPSLFDNLVDFQIYIGEQECEIQAYLSSPFQIACLAPPSKVAGNQIIKIYHANSVELECPKDVCLVSYIAQTGSLKYIVPTVLHPGDNIKVGGSGKSLQSFVQSRRSNQYFCDFLRDSSSDSDEFKECTVENLPSGYYTASIQIFSKQERVVLDSSANSDDFHVTIIPQIKALSKNKIGSAGDELTISGLGFSHVLDQNEVYYENNVCAVTFANNSVIKCDLVAPTLLSSAGNVRAGQSGVRSKTSTYAKSFQDVVGGSFSEDYSSFEYVNYKESPVSREMEGLFKAPATGAYNFYISAMGPAQLEISSAPLSQDNLIILAEVEKGTTEFRDFSASKGKSQIQLTAGEYYYLRVLHLDDGNGHLSVAVKIPGQSRIFAPIPSEFLFTAESLPQITVHTAGLLGSCPVGACDLELDKSANIPVFSDFGWNYNMLSISFQDPSSLSFSDFESISFGDAEAVILSYDSTAGILSASVALTTSQNQPAVIAGGHIPRVIITNSGFAQAAESVVPFEVSPMIVQADARGNGGFLEFDVQGAFFGFSIDESYGTKVDIGGVDCQVIELQNDYLKCVAEDIVTEGPFNVVVNGVQSQEDIVTFSDPGLLGAIQVVVDQERVLNIQVTGNFDPTLETVIAIVNTDGLITKCDERISQETGTLKCLISQLMPGDYNLVVTQIASLGFFYQSSRVFTVSYGIKSVSPSAGSQLGNTLLTLIGEGFLLENSQITIGSYGLPCNNVTLINSTAIQCLTNENIYSEAGPLAIKVTGASCLGKCSFTFSDSLTPLVQKISNSVVSPGSQVILSGVNFAAVGKDNIQVLIGGFKAAVLQVSTRALTIEIPENIFGFNLPIIISDSNLGNWKISADDDHEAIFVTIQPTIKDISPENGAASGTLLTINGEGFDSSNMSVMIGTNQSPCEIQRATWNQIVCKTGRNAAGKVKIQQNGVTATSSSVFVSSDSLTPVVSKITQTIAPYNKKTGSVGSLELKIEGIPSSAAIRVILTGQSGNIIEATPAGLTAVFTNPPSDTYLLTIQVGNFVADLDNSVNSEIKILPIFDKMPSIVSGFLGENKMTLTGSNFPKEAKDLDITVGGFPCLTTDIAFDSATCILPAFVTPENQDQLGAEKILTGATYFSSSGSSSGALLAFDSSVDTSFTAPANQMSCYFGLDVGKSLVANITKLALYPKDGIDLGKLQGARIEGSNDGKTYDQILEFDFTLQQGWNTLQTSGGNYRFIRFIQTNGSCEISELQISGVLLNAENDNSITPDVNIQVFGTPYTFKNMVNYRQENTPTILNAEPQFGPAAGGTLLKLTGQILTTNPKDVQVLIDGVPCQVSQVTTTEISCTTGAFPSLTERTDRSVGKIQVVINNLGQSIISSTVKYLYVDPWSDLKTWGTQGFPLEGDDINVSKTMNLLVDISPPQLGSLTIEGALIFDDQNIAFDCDSLIIQDGSLQIGTEVRPIKSTITLTLHGTILDEQLPLFGNKVIGLNGGTIDIHGDPRKFVSTKLAKTANAGDTIISIQDEVDFKIGDIIIISTTSLVVEETEQRSITAVSGTQITLDSPLSYEHLSEKLLTTIESSVALLSRNIVIKGDDDSSEQARYGAYFSVLRGIVRISYTEILNAGQAGMLGRFPFSFQGAGDQTKSYLRYNSIHNTYQRAVTLTGTSYLNIQNNLIYDVQDDAIKIGDGVSRFNTFASNILTYQRTFGNVAAAGFEINSPLNYFIANQVIGAAYGFRFSLGDTVEGGYSGLQTCSDGEKLGEFFQNTASSNSIYGLKINSYAPRAFPCNPVENNVPIESEFSEFTAYLNGQAGIQADNLGAVQFDFATIFDNVQSGIEIMKSNLGPQNSTIISNSLIARTGLVLPDSDNLLITDTTFADFPDGTFAIEASQGDLGSQKVFTKSLKFTNVNDGARVHFGGVKSAIFRDLDGSLTGLDNGGWLVANLPHIIAEKEKCQSLVSNALVCESEVEIIRLTFSGVLSSIAIADSSDLATVTSIPSSDPATIIFISGSNYNVDFGQQSLVNQELEISPNDNDLLSVPLTLVIQNDKRDIPVSVSNKKKSLSRLWDFENYQNYEFGDWYYDGDLFYLAITGNNPKKLSFEMSKNPNELFIRKWSNATQWPNKILPKKGDSVLIPSTWNIQLDMDPPTLGTLTIQGRLSFDSSRSDTSTLAAEKIVVIGTLKAVTDEKVNLVGQLQVTGRIELIGKSRNPKARLAKTVQAGATQIQIEGGDVSQWVKGDQILITASRMNPLEFDLKTIKAIQGNVITFNDPLDFSHSSEIYDTRTPLGQIDMRAEVLLLTRNVKIQGTTVIKNEAAFDLENVQFDFCSAETPVLDLASIKSGGIIKGSALSNCLGWGVKFSQTENIDFVDNIVFNVQDYGLIIGENNTALKIQDNSVVLVKSTENYQDKATSLTSAVYFAGCDDNDIFIVNNIASGCQNLCFNINFSNCKNGTAFFKNNTAYSSNIGFLAFNTTLEATEGFTAFQNSIGVATEAQDITLSSLRLADNSKSLVLYASNNLQLKDSFFAGFTSSESTCSASYGIIIGQASPDASCKQQISSGFAALENNYFTNFKKNDCADHKLFKVQHEFAGNMPLVRISASKSSEVDGDSLIFFNTTACNECSGIYNVLIKDIDGSLIGNHPADIIPNNIGVASESCDYHEAIDGYICSSENDSFGVLSFTSRSGSQTAQISSDTNSFLNSIFPLLNLCPSNDINQYTSLVEFGNTYNLSFEEDTFVPNTINFTLSGGANDAAAAFIIKYDDVRIVTITNIETQERIDPQITIVDKKPVLQLTDSCGANLIDLEQNYIEFNVRSDSMCKLSVSKVDSLVGYVRYDIAPVEFNARDGPSLFIEKLSSILQVSSSQVRVNRIKKGSTIVDFTILAESLGTNKLQQQLETLREATAQGKISLLGAPVLDYSYKTITADEDAKPAATVSQIEAGGHSVGFYFGMVLGPLILVLLLGIIVYRWDRSHRKNKVRVAAEIKVEQVTTQSPTQQVTKISSIRQAGTFMIGPDRELIDNPLTLQTLPTESDVGDSEMETPRTERGGARDDMNLLKRKNLQDLNTVLENNEEEDLNDNNHQSEE